MIGIDIVDLTDHKLQRRDERSLRLVLHPEDRVADDPLSFWLLWTAKEAVFKAQRKEMVFSPTSIPIAIEKRATGFFNFQSSHYQGIILSNRHFVCAVCGWDDVPVFRIYYSKHAADNNFIRQKIAAVLPRGLALSADEAGLPVITPGPQLVSITHHQHYAAFAM